MKESTSIKKLMVSLKNGEMGFFESDDIDGPGFLYKTKSGRLFGSGAFKEINIKTMLEFEKRLK